MVGQLDCIMLGLYAAPRWRLPLFVVIFCTMLAGCATRQSASGAGSHMPDPLIKMALVKFPLNGTTDNDLLDDGPPIERFVAETRQVSNGPSW